MDLLVEQVVEGVQRLLQSVEGFHCILSTLVCVVENERLLHVAYLGESILKVSHNVLCGSLGLVVLQTDADERLCLRSCSVNSAAAVDGGDSI